VAECYRLLAEFTRRMADGVHEPEHAEVLQREMRRQLELARRALEATAARVVARTVRARNLTVLLETADMLFATTLRWTELANGLKDPDSLQALSEAAAWLSGAGRAIFAGLQQRPLDSAASYLPEGSHSMEFIRGRPLPRRELSPYSGQPLISAAGSALAHLAADERDAVQNVQIAFESVRAIWSGLEMKRGAAAERWMMLTREPSVSDIETVRREDVLESRSAGWWSNCVTNWTFDSLMMRHALRMGVVGGVDVVLLQLLHVRHGSWLAMTSIIVLQPYGSGTLRRGFERVGGTIAGGVLAAVLAAGVQSEAGIIFAITLTSVLTLALYTVNYAWYCFFLTPTFVLMSMPHLRDWQFAGVRMGNTVLGALVAAMAMRLLWPEKQHIELGRLLGRGAEASAAYLQAMTEAWRRRDAANPEIDRRILAPARRLCGLTINDAEESLDRMLLEPDFGGRNKNDPSPTPDAKTEALTFVTYLRRLMRTATALTAVQPPNEQTVQCIEALTMRLKQAADTLVTGISAEGIATPATETKTSEQITQGLVGSPEAESIQEQQVRRLERQIGVLERAATALASKPD